MGLSVGGRGAVVASSDVVVGVILSDANGRLWVGRRRVPNGREASRSRVRSHRRGLRTAVMAVAVVAAVLRVPSSLFLACLAIGLFSLLARLPLFANLLEFCGMKCGQSSAKARATIRPCHGMLTGGDGPKTRPSKIFGRSSNVPSGTRFWPWDCIVTCAFKWLRVP